MPLPTEFTLEELANFELCLFPEDYENGLRAAGVSEENIRYYLSNLKRPDGKNRHFMEMYQEYISDSVFVAAITRMAGIHVAWLRTHKMRNATT